MGVLCQPCSLIRNDLEIRQRESMKQEADLPPPHPLGENYQPIFGIKPDGYKSEPRMTTPRGILKSTNSPETSTPPDGQPTLREVRFHEPGQGNAPNVAASYPTEVGYVAESPISPRTEAGPSNPNRGRSREGTLTPIEETDSQAAEERKRSVILGPAMNTFQRTTSPPVLHVTTSSAPIQAPIPTRDHDRNSRRRSTDTDRLAETVQSQESPRRASTGSTNARGPGSFKFGNLEYPTDGLDAPRRSADSSPTKAPRSNVARLLADSPPTSQRSRDLRLSEDRTDVPTAEFPVTEARVPSPELSRRTPNIGKVLTPGRKSRFSEEFDHPSPDELFHHIPDAAPSSSLNAPPRLPHLPGAFDTPAMTPTNAPARSLNVPTQLPHLPGAFPSPSHSEAPTRKPSALDQLAALRDVANQSPKVVTGEETERVLSETIPHQVDKARVGDRPNDISRDPQLDNLAPSGARHHLSIDEQLA